MNHLMQYLIKSNSRILGITLCLLCTSFLNCANQQKQIQKMEDAAVQIIYKKERTRGMRNPIFTIELLENRVVKYTGIANVSVIGEKMITIDRTTYNKIITEFQAAHFTKFRASYKGKMRDLSLTTLIYQDHSVTYQEEVCPKKLEDLAKMMENLVNKI